MNSRILLIVFTTISYLGVTKSAQTEESQQRIVTSLPTLTDATTPTPQIIQINKTNINIEFHNNTNSSSITTSTTTQSSVTPSNKSTIAPPHTTTFHANTTITTISTNTTTSTEKITTNSINTTISLPTTPSHKVTTAASENTTTPNSGHDRQFDGPSFIGGIVLTFGLIAIGFIAFKFYKAGKLDMNYRTLSPLV